MISFIFGIFVFAGAILPVMAFAQDYEDSPFGIATAGFIFNIEEVNAIDRIRNIGAGWVRGKSRFGRLIWDDLEPEKGVYDWTTMDNFYNKAIENELHILTHIITYNNWDQPDAVCEPCFDGGCMYPATLPNDMDAYKTLVEKAMQRYPEIKKWVIGQEIPAGDYRWDGTAEDYAELFAETYSTIKNIDPADEVILYNIGYAAMDDESYRAQFLKAVLNQLGNNKGIRDFSVAVDSYQHADDLNIIEILNYVRSIISGEGFTEEEIPIILTDVTQLVDKEDIVVPEALQAGNVVKIYTKALAYGIKYVSWAQLGDAYHKKNKEAAFFTKVVENEEVVAHKKLAYFTYKLMTEKLEGSEWDNIQKIQESDNVYIYKFTKKYTGAPVYIAWWDYFDETSYTPGDTKPITLTGLTGAEAIVTDMVPDYDDGSQVTDYESAFTVTTYHLSNGSVTISLGEDPVLIETGNTHLIIDSGDYNGDGTTDIAVFRESSGLWAVRGITRLYFGTTSDIPVPGDYDGDGFTEPAVFRGSSGLWAVRELTRLYFGALSDHPLPGDFDGDGSCDVGIFREESGLWAVRGITRAYFGTTGDNPVPGDYSSDGTNDIGIFRGSSGLWALRNISRVYFGSSEDRAVPGDFDGSGAYSPAIFRPASGLWAISGLTRIYFGDSSDQPVPADYNGDGTDDIGVFQAGSGLWAVRDITRVYFGAADDLPVTR